VHTGAEPDVGHAEAGHVAVDERQGHGLEVQSQIIRTLNHGGLGSPSPRGVVIPARPTRHAPTVGERVEQCDAKTAPRLDKRPKTGHTRRLLHEV